MTKYEEISNKEIERLTLDMKDCNVKEEWIIFTEIFIQLPRKISVISSTKTTKIQTTL